MLPRAVALCALMVAAAGVALPPIKLLVAACGDLTAVATDASLGLNEWTVAGSIKVEGSAAESTLPTTTEIRVLKPDSAEPTVASCTIPSALPAAELNRWAAAVLDAIKPEAVEIAIDLPLHKLRQDSFEPREVGATLSGDSLPSHFHVTTPLSVVSLNPLLLWTRKTWRIPPAVALMRPSRLRLHATLSDCRLG